MKIQEVPLYAIDREGNFHAVVGWREDPSTGRSLPVIVPLGQFGTAVTFRGDLAFLPDAPDVAHEVAKLKPAAPRPADAQTEIIERTARPIHLHPRY